MTSPVPFSPDLERIEPNEEETGRGLREVFRSIMATTAKDYGHAVRSVEAKNHALLEGTLTVKADLPATWNNNLPDSSNMRHESTSVALP